MSVPIKQENADLETIKASPSRIGYFLYMPLNAAYSISSGVKWTLGLDRTSKDRKIIREFEKIEKQYQAVLKCKNEIRENIRNIKKSAKELKASDMLPTTYKASVTYLEYQDQKNKYLQANKQYSALQIKLVNKGKDLFERGLLDPEHELYKRIAESFEKSIQNCIENEFYRPEELQKMSNEFYKNK